ncbi:hypothetical protein FKP32DRAFT_1579413, partial [Trametes sanguinea]
LCRSVEGLMAQITLLEDKILQSRYQEVRLHEVLHSMELLLNKFQELFFQASETLKDVSAQLRRIRADCVYQTALC